MTIALVVVSLLTAPEDRAQIDAFFTRLETPSDERAPGPLLLVNLRRLRRAAAGRGWRAYGEDLAGFGLGWAIVAALVTATALFLSA